MEFVKNEEDLEGNKVDMKFTIGSYVAFKVSKYIQTVASNLTVYYSKNWKSGDWLNNLNEGLQQCRLFVFIITQQALDSKWMDYEFGASVALHSNVLDNKENFVLFNLTKVNRSKSIPATVGLQFCDLDVSGIEHFLDVLKRCFPECEFKNKPKLSVWENMYQKDVNDAISLINTSYVSNDDLRRDFNSIIDEKVNRINDLTKKLNNGNLHNKDIEELKKEVQSLSGNNGILTPNNNKFNKDVLKPASQTTDKTYKRAKILALSFGVLLLISLLCISLLKIKER
ncbi:MAG: TIR domain-containing protein, partial [Bacteroidales bacterium]|nr:TIR domain-containing protein [Bacteroidales bacterium]